MQAIRLYAETPAAATSDFIPREEAGCGYQMKLFSINDKESYWQGTFELMDGRLYSQRFWKEGKHATDIAVLEEIRGVWVTADIELNDRGYQRLFNVVVMDEQPEQTRMTTSEYLDSMPDLSPQQQEDAPF
jgi:hypothetical protein